MNKNPFLSGSLLVAYLRDSGHETQELSIEQQEQELRSWCDRHDYILNRIYKDTGTGTTTTGRDQFKKMLRYMRSDRRIEKGLIVWKWSRFARNIDDAQFYRADLRRRGITLHSINDDIPQGPEGRFFEAAIDWMNQAYIDDLKEDTKRGLKNLVENYGYVPGTPPKGFKREKVVISTHRDGKPHVGHRWVPDPDLIPLVREAWQLRAENTPYSEIAEKTQLFRSKNSFTSFFRNPIYIGILEYGDDVVITDYCDPIISKETWLAVQEINKKNKKYNKENKMSPYRRYGSSFALSGLVYCARCGHALTGSVHHSKGHIYKYYRCSRGQRARDCDAPPIPQNTLEDAVRNELMAYFNHPQAVEELRLAQIENIRGNQEDLQAKRDALAKELKSVNSKISNTTSAIAETGHSDALLDRLSDLENRKTIIENRLVDLDVQLQSDRPVDIDEMDDILTKLEKTIQDASTKELKKIYSGVIKDISVQRVGDTKIEGVITFYLPQEKDSPPGDEESMVGAYGKCPGRVKYCKHKEAVSVSFQYTY